ncbi:MAG: hypothetical protein HQ553_03205 [Chloroflexi bacterium]|nr:hypothetical protein [Chloroflexota bacterium]
MRKYSSLRKAYYQKNFEEYRITLSAKNTDVTQYMVDLMKNYHRTRNVATDGRVNDACP